MFARFLFLIMALGSVLQTKDFAPQGYQPLLLVEFTFADGSKLFASTHNLNPTEGGTTYKGQSYLARVSEESIEAIQSRSQQGIDRISDVTLKLNNADQFLYNNYETAFGKGFKGALVKLSLVMMDIDPTNGTYVFTNDSQAPVKFSGICDAPDSGNGEFLTIRATTSRSLARVQFPVIHVQQRCVNPFPLDFPSRQAAAADMGSWFYACGYSPDVTGKVDPELGGNAARGNLTTPNATDAQGNFISDGAGVYTQCNHTKADCTARGMYSKDSANRRTGRFTAIQWAPAQRETRSKSYIQGKDVTVFNGRNDSIYQRSYPMVYGSQWVKKPIIANILGDGNSTRFEVVVCVGDIGPDGINQVVVNGVIVPPLSGGTDPLFRWNFLDAKVAGSTATGGRSGYINLDNSYSGAGDPYGSLATIEIVVYSDLAQSNSSPDIRILLNHGPKVKVPNTTNAADQPSWPYLNSSSPAWVLLDLLIWANYNYSEIDIQSFMNADAVCSAQVSYINLAGQTASHNRFIAELALEDYRSAAEAMQALCRSFNAQLVPNSESGLLQLFIRQTLADQQPLPIDGSNYVTPIRSMKADGTIANGYVAYLIDESVIQQDGKGQPKLRGPYSQPSAQTGNRIVFGFQDQDNAHSDDSISVVDPEDVARSGGFQAGGQQVPQQIAVLGVPNFDQGIRIANVALAENFRGNENGDSRGTRWWDIEEATSRLAHLKVGQIVLLRYQSILLQPGIPLQSPPGNAISGILARVEAIRPTTNYERVTVTVRWHEDVWYTDLYGQEAQQLHSDPSQQLPNRLPYPWKPAGELPISGDSVWDGTEQNFAIAQTYQTSGGGSQIAGLQIAGFPPLNQFGSIQPPLFERLQGSTAPSGGNIPGNTHVIMALTVQGSDGKWSPLSKFAVTITAPGGNTNTAVTPPIFWPDGVVQWVLYGGYDEQTMTSQVTGTGTPATIAIPTLAVSGGSAPDVLADSLLIRVKGLIHGGPWGDACYAVSSAGDGTGFISFGGALTNNQFAGCDITLLARSRARTGQNVPIADFRVIGNVGGVLHVTPDPTFPGFTLPGLPAHWKVEPGDVFEMRANGTNVTATSIGDPNMQSAYFPLGMLTPYADGTPNDERGRRVRIMKGTGRGQVRTIIGFDATSVTIETPWDVLPDSTSRWVVEEAAWQTQTPARMSTSAIHTGTPTVVGISNINAYQGKALLVQALIQDQRGNRSLSRFSPIREIFLWGQPANSYSYTGRILLPGTQTVATDVLANRYRVVNLPNGVQLAAVSITAKVAPTSSSYIADALRSSDNGATWQSLFPSGNANKIVLPVGSGPLTLTPTFAISTLLLNDLVRVDVLQADGAVSGVEIALLGYVL